MGTTLVQFRYDEKNKEKANDICNQLGIDLQTYMKMSLNRLIIDEGIPFSMTLKTKKTIGTIMDSLNKTAEENGTADMSLDEINAEIAESRKKRRES